MPAHKVTSKLCQMAAGDTFLHLPAFRCDREDDLCDSGYTSDWGSERCVSSSLDPFHPFLAANRASDEWRTSDKVVCMYSPLHLGRVARHHDKIPLWNWENNIPVVYITMKSWDWRESTILSVRNFSGVGRCASVYLLSQRSAFFCSRVQHDHNVFCKSFSSFLNSCHSTGHVSVPLCRPVW